MSKDPTYITLSEALSWLAFGVMRDRQALNYELARGSFGLPSAEAKKLLKNAVCTLAGQAHAGNIWLEGKWLQSSTDDPIKAQNGQIPKVNMADYRAFDITTDGLRFGDGLLWLPDHTSYWTYAVPQRPEHYVKVLVKLIELKKHLKPGNSPVYSQPKRPNLAPAKYKKWWEGLTTPERRSSEKELIRICEEMHPENRILRQSIRDIRGPQKRGPKPISR